MRQEIKRWLRWNTHYKYHSLSMEDKMAAAAFGRATNYGWDGSVNSNSRHDSDEWTWETVKCETSYCFPLAMEIIRFHYVRKDSRLLPAWIPNSTVRTSRKAARSLAFLVFLTKKSFLSCSAFCRWWQTTRYALSMQDKMAAWAFGRATNYGWDRPTGEIT